MVVTKESKKVFILNAYIPETGFPGVFSKQTAPAWVEVMELHSNSIQSTCLHHP